MLLVMLYKEYTKILGHLQLSAHFTDFKGHTFNLTLVCRFNFSKDVGLFLNNFDTF